MLVVAFLYALTLRNKIALRHIPSPPSWPLIGHVPTVIFGKPWEAFTKWSHKYGKIYTMYVLLCVGARACCQSLCCVVACWPGQACVH